MENEEKIKLLEEKFDNYHNLNKKVIMGNRRIISHYQHSLNLTQMIGWFKFILGLFIGILIAITLMGATEIYSGSSYSFPTEEFEYYTVVNNQSSIEGMEVEWLGGNTTISFSPAFISDNFTIVFYNEKVVTNTVNVGDGGSSGSGGGGGSRIIYKDKVVTDYVIVEKEVVKEVPTEIVVEKETIVEKVVNKIPNWVAIFIIILIISLVVLGWMLFRKE